MNTNLDKYIESVDRPALEEAIREKEMDDGSKKLLAAEKQYYVNPRREGDRNNDSYYGLALSGGGIRSATFSLGVLQRLAKNKLLEKIDYLSTVSGGGYIGSSLTWFLNSGVK